MAHRVGRFRKRFWAEVFFALVAVLSLALTLVWPQWIELIFGVDPDGGDGSIERVIAISTSVSSVGALLLAGIEWRRPRSAAGDSI